MAEGSSVGHPRDNSADWFLQALVDLVNGTDLGIAVTLNAGGLIISGELISGHRYFEAFSEDIKRALGSGENAVRAANHFRQLGDIYKKPSPKGEEESTDTEVAWPSFLHLRNARIFQPGQMPIPTTEGMWWRGRLDAIDGFIFGALQAEMR